MRVRERLLLTLLILSAVGAVGQNRYQVLHAFNGGTDGGGLWSSVVFDPQDNLYGTTSGGGLYGYGTVYELALGPDGEWNESVLYNLPNPYTTGEPGIPFGGPTLDGVGNIYGTTQKGGVYQFGAAFELTPGAGGWEESVIHDFGGPGDLACCPWGNLIMDRLGNLYGTGGIAFELSPNPDGSWRETMLHNFAGQNGDGMGPFAGPIFDPVGNLYGTTRYGGVHNAGIVYQLRPLRTNASGTWKERILHTFGSFSGDGGNPGAGQLAMDRFGSVYGTTQVGGDGLRYRIQADSCSSHPGRRVGGNHPP